MLFLQRTVPLSFLLAASSGAGLAQVRVTWSEFSTKVTPRHAIRMVMPDGTHIEGYPLQAKADALDIHVTRTSNKQAHPEGNATIPRESVSVVQMRRPRRAGKLIGALAPIGVGAAIMAAGIAGNQGSDAVYGYAVVGGLTMGLGAPAGFFVGRAVDRRFDEFVIIPEPPGAR
jgi:hypothetical protein